MTEALLAVVIVLMLVSIGLVVALLRRNIAPHLAEFESHFESVDRGQERTERAVRDQIADSFKLFVERLEHVHKGLGELQSLASGVNDLKRVLTNVSTRGTWGEIQLGTLLEQVLSPQQYARNVATNDATNQRVEFAIKLPGRADDPNDVVWLPIDAKFPQEDYQRLLAAQEQGDQESATTAAKQLDARIKASARDIRDKYLNPPKTTDFAIMFLPSEGLYAEVVRRPGLMEFLQRQYRVSVAGPTTLAVLLNALQMGFRTLAVQRRSSEVWKILGAVKTELGKFGGLLDAVQKKLHEASAKVDDATKKTRTIATKLRNVEELPPGEDGGLQPESVLIEPRDGRAAAAHDKGLPAEPTAVEGLASRSH